MTPRTTSHLVLVLIGVLWGVLVISNLEYLGRFAYHTYLVSIRWLQFLFIGLSVYGIWSLLYGLRKPQAPAPPATHRPFVSILVPAKDEERVIEETLRVLAALDYHAAGRRRFEVLVIDDGSTDRTPEILARLESELGIRAVRTDPGGRSKAAALNHGLRYARGELIAVFDADARVAPDFLQRLVASLDGPQIAGVQGRRVFYNGAQNALTRMQQDEFGILLTCLQRTREAVGGFVNFAGNGLLARRSALDAVGGFNEDAITEDIDISIRLYLAGWRIRYRDDAPVWEEAVTTLRALVRQRTRWFEGGLRCLGEHLPKILAGRMPLATRLDTLFFLTGVLLAGLALLTTYTYTLIGLAGAVLLFLGVPQWVMAALAGAFTLTLIAASVKVEGWHPLSALGVVIRQALFSLHRIATVPLGILRYVRGAVTGRVDWAKTVHVGPAAHVGATAPEGVSPLHPGAR